MSYPKLFLLTHNWLVWLIIFAGTALLVTAACVHTTRHSSSSKKQPLTIDAIFAEHGILGPNPETLTWSPDGTKLSYIQREKDGNPGGFWYIDAISGKRNLMISARELATMAPPNSAIEDAVERERRSRYGVVAYQWGPDSRHLLFDANGQLWYYDSVSKGLKGFDLKYSVVDPKIAPDGHAISYVKNRDLFVRQVNTGKEARLTMAQGRTSKKDNLLNGEVDWLYEEELGVRSNYFWSSDSAELLFLQTDLSKIPVYPVVDYIPPHATATLEKYPLVGDPIPEVRLGIVSDSGGPTKWLRLPSANAYIPRFGWVGKRLAYAMVLNRKQDELDLYFIDTASGRSKLVLSEGGGSEIEMGKTEFRALTSGNQFLWTSWRDGFTHIFLYTFDASHPLDGPARLKRQLTRGNFEVSRIEAVDDANQTVYYTSNEADDREQQLYSLGLDGSSPKRLTTQAGVYDITFNPTATAYLSRYSRIDKVPDLSLCLVAGSCSQIYSWRQVANTFDISAPKSLDFVADDGTVLHAMLYLPSSSSNQVPVVLTPYGGSAAQLVRDTWSQTSLFDRVLAANGMAALVIDNRGSANRGGKFISAVRFRLGDLELKDQLSGLDQALREYPQLDASRIGICGWSYGGFMTLYAMTHSSRFTAGCAGSPVSDWRLYDATYSERFMGLLPENREGYERSAPLSSAASLKGRLLITHGLSDVNVHPQNTFKMADALVRAGIPFDMMLYPRQVHGFTDAAAPHVYNKFVAHLKRYLLEQTEK